MPYNPHSILFFAIFQAEEYNLKKRGGLTKKLPLIMVRILVDNTMAYRVGSSPPKRR